MWQEQCFCPACPFLSYTNENKQKLKETGLHTLFAHARQSYNFFSVQSVLMKHGLP